jgi:hypothetical protein
MGKEKHMMQICILLFKKGISVYKTCEAGINEDQSEIVMNRGAFAYIVDQECIVCYNRRNPSASKTDEVACNQINS